MIPSNGRIALRWYMPSLDGIPVGLFMNASMATHAKYLKIVWVVVVVIEIFVMDTKILCFFT